MKVKVCGMKHPENMQELAAIPVDMMGMIFYEKSLRYVGEPDAEEINALPPSILKVGVFVDASVDCILNKKERYQLQMIQLHGNESPAFCKELKKNKIRIIKAFSVEEPDDLRKCLFYNDCCDYYLFDTRTPQYGGSGKKFDWKILSVYSGEKPFFLSGGIALEDAKAIGQLNYPQLFAVDLNSRFECLPGLKDIDKINQFLKKINDKEAESSDK
jgi:phosphoribosylanthranilate isomerase